jgi:hypothetical protein
VKARYEELSCGRCEAPVPYPPSFDEIQCPSCGILLVGSDIARERGVSHETHAIFRRGGKAADVLDLFPEPGDVAGFFQSERAPWEREAVGLQEILRREFPVLWYPDQDEAVRTFKVGFNEYRLEEPDEQGRALLWLRLQLCVFAAATHDVVDIVEQDVPVGMVTLPTERGTFVIGGVELDINRKAVWTRWDRTIRRIARDIHRRLGAIEDKVPEIDFLAHGPLERKA